MTQRVPTGSHDRIATHPDLSDLLVSRLEAENVQMEGDLILDSVRTAA